LHKPNELGGEIQYKQRAAESWRLINSPQGEITANSWYNNHELETITTHLLNTTETDTSLGLIRHWLTWLFTPAEALVQRDIVSSPEKFGSPQFIETSETAGKIFQMLSRLNIAWRYASNSTIFEEVNVASDDGQFLKNKIEILLPSANEFLIVSLELRKIKSGQETLVLYFPALSSNRNVKGISRWYVDNSSTENLDYDEIASEDLGRSLNIGDWPQHVSHKVFSKHLFALFDKSKTKFNFGQGASRPSVETPTNVLCTLMHFEEQSKISRDWIGPDQAQYTAIMTSPSVTNLGWAISNLDLLDPDFDLAIFLEWFLETDHVLSYGYSVNKIQEQAGVRNEWADLTLPTKYMLANSQVAKVNYGASWLPISEMVSGLLDSKRWLNDYVMDNSRLADPRSLLEKIISNGIGSSFASAVNTYCFYYLFPEGELDLAEALLTASIEMKVPDESLNSLSNFGICLFIRGDLAQSTKIFEKVIAESLVLDDYSNLNEVYLYLAKIADAQGDPSQAHMLRDKSVEHGPYEFHVFERKSIPTKFESESVFSSEFGVEIRNSLLFPDLVSDSHKGAYCSHCGFKFIEDRELFCIECGEERR